MWRRSLLCLAFACCAGCVTSMVANEALDLLEEGIGIAERNHSADHRLIMDGFDTFRLRTFTAARSDLRNVAATQPDKRLDPEVVELVLTHLEEQGKAISDMRDTQASNHQKSKRNFEDMRRVRRMLYETWIASRLPAQFRAYIETLKSREETDGATESGGR